MTLATRHTWKIHLTTSSQSSGTGTSNKTRRIMSGDYHTHTDRKYDEIIERLEALERKVGSSKLMMKRDTDGHYERLVDVVLEHDKTITEIVEHTVGNLNEGDTNW